MTPERRRAIGNRAGWICYLCQRPVERDRTKYPWPHPLSATTDHVVPLSAGGRDEQSNIRLAHWHCNESKGDQLPGVEVFVPWSVQT